MFALVRQLQALIGADSDLELDDCDYSTNKQGDYNGYDGGFVVNVRAPSAAAAGSLLPCPARLWLAWRATGVGACALY